MVERKNKNDRKGGVSVINIIVCLWYPSDGMLTWELFSCV